MPNVGITDQRGVATIPEQKGLYERSGDVDKYGHYTQVSKLGRLRCETGIS
jgi:hypothetical protein